MYHIRETKTQSGARAVQVVEYVKRKVKVIKHIGSGRGEAEIQSLKKVAEAWVKQNTRQKTLFDKPEENRPNNIALLSQCEYLGIHQTFIYEILTKLLERFEFTSIGNQLLNDLVIMRLIEPASKLRSLELLREYFGINHRRQTFYDGATTRVVTANGDLICSFSEKRYRKDKREMDKQIKKAEELLSGKTTTIKRAKFLKNVNKKNYEINNSLIEKTKLLLGIKGYYTNLEAQVGDQVVIDHYHNLWRVEQAFRIAKNDLETRPIFHFKEDAIKVHMMICFMALAISKYLEIKTAKPLQPIIHALKQVTDARLLNTLTRQEITLRSKIPEEVENILENLNLSY